ncbi:hypothetical protein [Bacillus thermotolerans]|uniref:TPR repeat protein n=1 Tax=Bacillus thermotolerans TaxID=1221996 RepID=A0A0F5IDX7_BACTR|nr:hypothetical protein [Bacillus thermotolerans]KKB43382.1 TPR repeat protein [Bacillus thermotolerans]KKB43497.1 TPR repeat protein [Bacillus thermotolerans]
MKRKKWDRKGNIFIFPGTSEALIQKGRAALEEKNYDQAVIFLSEALEYAADQEGDIKMALLLALYESGQHDPALEICMDMLHQGLGDYYDVLDIYMLILMHQKKYEEMSSMLTALMEEKEFPDKKKEYFESLLSLSNKMNMSPEKEWQPLFSGKEGIREQMLKLMELTHVNIQPYMGELTAFLRDQEAHPFLQTLALNVLKEHGVEKPVEVRKFQFKETVIPAELPDAFEKGYFKGVIRQLETELADTNPVLLEQAVEMTKRHFSLLYPFEPAHISMPDWTEAVLLLLDTYYEGRDLEPEGVNPSVYSGLAFIRRLDEISLTFM